MADPLDRLEEAAEAALEASNRLYGIASELIDGDADEVQVADLIEASALDIRRHGMSMKAEVFMRRKPS